MVEPKECNHLGKETSPYLLQHKNNPVCWYSWGDAAFTAAKRENKPIFLSIGYSTCYWCHVMEKDSFELEEVAEVLNKHFISIKVDREERPDVDQIYMDAVMSLTGHGGWPMSVFLTPDKEPFWGGTFFYRKQFLQILSQLEQAWKNDREKIFSSAKKITKFIQDKDGPNVKQEVGELQLKKVFEELARRFDDRDGGFGGAPKFPPSTQVALLLRLSKRFENVDQKKAALQMANLTLEKMARGGIYDHLGGGFHRYSTDGEWLVPHFEKMLYDNALLTVAYLEAFQLTKNTIYAEVARETLDYVLRVMTAPEGGFYSAEDAGEVDKEGEFYVWSAKELKQELDETEYTYVSKVYGLTEQGNFEGHNILTLDEQYSWSEKKNPDMTKILEKLMAVRERREHPHKDDKILTAWNGMMISAFARGYQVLGDQRYLKAGVNAANFIDEKLSSADGLSRTYRAGEAKYQAYVEDYAFYIEGLLHLFESDFNPRWYKRAVELQKLQDQKFWDKENSGYDFSEASDVIFRKKGLTDGATPSANSVTALNLLRLYAFSYEKGYLDRYRALLAALSESINKYPSAHTKVLHALDFELDRAKEVAVVLAAGDTGKEILQYLHSSFLPNKVVALGKLSDEELLASLPLMQNKPLKNNRTTIYVCEDRTCKLPVNDPKELETLLEDQVLLLK